MTSISGDATFVAEIRRGDQSAWREFIAQYEGRVTAFVRRRLGASSAVDDVVQETFVGFLVSLPNFDPQRGLETYLFSIASHKLTDYLRREGRRPTVPLSAPDDTSRPDAGPIAPGRSAAGAYRSDERKSLESDALAESLGEILERWREKGEWQKVACTELLIVRGRTNKDAAAALGISEQAVANMKFDFLSRLRDAVRRRRLSPDVFPELAT